MEYIIYNTNTEEYTDKIMNKKDTMKIRTVSKIGTDNLLPQGQSNVHITIKSDGLIKELKELYFKKKSKDELKKDRIEMGYIRN